MPTGPGDILDLIRHGRASTRGDVLEATGLSRMTVAQRLDALLGAAMIVEGDTTEATGGRRRRSLTFNTSQSRVLASLSIPPTRTSPHRPRGTVLAEDHLDVVRGGRSERGAGSDSDGRGGADGPAGVTAADLSGSGSACPDRSTPSPDGPVNRPSCRGGRLLGRRAPARVSPVRLRHERRRCGRPRRVRGGLSLASAPVPGQGLHGHRHRNRHRRALLPVWTVGRRHRPRAGITEVEARQCGMQGCLAAVAGGRAVASGSPPRVPAPSGGARTAGGGQR